MIPNKKTQLVYLSALSACSCLLVLGVYAVISPNRLSSRLGFALFTSIAPAIVSLMVLGVVRLSKAGIALLYIGLFVALQGSIALGSWMGR